MVLRDPYGNRISREDGKVITDNQGIRNACEWDGVCRVGLRQKRIYQLRIA